MENRQLIEVVAALLRQKASPTPTTGRHHPRRGRPIGASLSRDIILHILAKEFPKPLSFGGVCEATGLATGTTAKHLKALHNEGLISKRTEGRKQLYEAKSLESYSRPLYMYGSRKAGQWRRAVSLGLNPIWVKNPRGRPKQFPDMDMDWKMTKKIMAMPPGARRYLRTQAGLQYAEYYQGPLTTFGYTDKSVDTINKTIDKARHHYQMLAKLRTGSSNRH